MLGMLTSVRAPAGLTHVTLYANLCRVWAEANDLLYLTSHPSTQGSRRGRIRCHSVHTPAVAFCVGFPAVSRLSPLYRSVFHQRSTYALAHQQSLRYTPTVYCRLCSELKL